PVLSPLSLHDALPISGGLLGSNGMAPSFSFGPTTRVHIPLRFGYWLSSKACAVRALVRHSAAAVTMVAIVFLWFMRSLPCTHHIIRRPRCHVLLYGSAPAGTI